MRKPRVNFLRRQRRTRFTLKHKSSRKLRLSVHRTNRHIYAQIIDDTAGQTVVSASTLESDSRELLTTGSNKKAATLVGEIIAKRALAEGIKEVFFDRGGFLYHGRIKALAESARINGLVF